MGNLAERAAALRRALPHDAIPEIKVHEEFIEVFVYEERGLPLLRRVARALDISDADLRVIRPVVFLQPYPGDDAANEVAFQAFVGENVRLKGDGSGVQLTSMDPVVAADCRVLILGSMPGQVSLQSGEYYANPQNRFWRVMEAIFGVSQAGSYQQRTSDLKLAGVALWDVLKHCSRIGSLDSTILPRTEVPNNLVDVLKRHPTIERVVFNGRKAAQSYHRLVEHDLPDELRNRISSAVAPSTSAANARVSIPALIDAWRKAVGVTA